MKKIQMKSTSLSLLQKNWTLKTVNLIPKMCSKRELQNLTYVKYVICLLEVFQLLNLIQEFTNKNLLHVVMKEQLNKSSHSSVIQRKPNLLATCVTKCTWKPAISLLIWVCILEINLFSAQCVVCNTLVDSRVCSLC